jgi:hypothetical protein
MAYVEKNVEVRTVTNASAQFAHSMVKGRQYVLRADTDLWYAIAANPTAVKATTGSVFLARGDKALIGTYETLVKIAVIRDAADGNAILDELAPTQ